MDKGFVYAVSDPMWMAETVRSANSCRKLMPDLAIELFATPDIVSTLDRRAKKLFDKVVSLDPPTFINRPRFDAMRLSKLKRAVFIDSDTYFVKPVYEIFDALDNYDIAACVDQQHIHGQYVESGLDKILPPISDAISEWNSGVFVVKKCEATGAFIDRWVELFKLCWENDFYMDQASMRVAISQADRKHLLKSVHQF